jgi:hypothetical protein
MVGRYYGKILGGLIRVFCPIPACQLRRSSGGNGMMRRTFFLVGLIGVPVIFALTVSQIHLGSNDEEGREESQRALRTFHDQS